MQCLQTSELISHWSMPSPCRTLRSTNATWRHVLALSSPVLSNEWPVQTKPSSGTRFHSLHATSHALHPMQTDVSVKNPIRGWASAPYDRCPSAVAELNVPPPPTSKCLSL